MMIPMETILTFFVAAIFTFILPIALTILFLVRRTFRVKPMLLGYATFFVTQFLIRMPLLGLFESQQWYQTLSSQLAFYLLFLSLTAGIFEESGRYLVSRGLLKNHRFYRDAIAFGLGHGLCEVILINGMAQIENIIQSFMINNNNALLFESQAALLNIDPMLVYVGVLERVFAVVFHIFAAVLVFKAVIDKKPALYFLAIGIHTVYNYVAVLLNYYLNVWAAEIFLGVATIVFVIGILRLNTTFPIEEVPIEPTQLIEPTQPEPEKSNLHV